MKANHINYPDANNEIYCKRIDSALKLDSKGSFWKTCIKCPMFNGTYQGNGVECLYDDPNAISSVVYGSSSQK